MHLKSPYCTHLRMHSLIIIGYNKDEDLVTGVFNLSGLFLVCSILFDAVRSIDCRVLAILGDKHHFKIICSWLPRVVVQQTY